MQRVLDREASGRGVWTGENHRAALNIGLDAQFRPVVGVLGSLAEELRHTSKYVRSFR